MQTTQTRRRVDAVAAAQAAAVLLLILLTPKPRNMPEFRECLAHYLIFSLFWEYQRDQLKANFQLLGLLADLTNEEVRRTHTAQDGLVQRLGPTCNFKRGCNLGQTDLYPALLRSTSKNPNPPSIQTLELRRVNHTSRAILLDFGVVHLKVCHGICIINSQST
jgi:hypothetical protein